jgi:hypothetical protein
MSHENGTATNKLTVNIGPVEVNTQGETISEVLEISTEDVSELSKLMASATEKEWLREEEEFDALRVALDVLPQLSPKQIIAAALESLATRTEIVVEEFMELRGLDAHSQEILHHLLLAKLN